MPDGTNMGTATSNLFATFNAKFGSASTWENVILKAAQQWALQTNFNFAVIPDSGAPEGSGSYQQGDPTMGDIRIGGFNFSSNTLASTFMPPPVNNYSIAGDMWFNTGQTFNINGQNYDLFTVAEHEFGHALGLYHSGSISAAMYGVYSGAKSGLASDDVAGIRNIYSNNNPRSQDQYGGTNNSFPNAADLTSQINTTNDTLLVTGLGITQTAQKEYFTLTAPSGTGSTVTIDVQSNGLSLLAPTLYVYAADQVTVLGHVSGTGQYGTTLTLNLTNVAAGQQIYVKVGGADNTALGTGTYALTASFAGNPLPAVPLPNTQVANGTPLSGGGGEAMIIHANDTTTLTALLMNQLMHGGGCNCPYCRAAAAAVQQSQPVVTGLKKITADADSTEVGVPVANAPRTSATTGRVIALALVEEGTSGRGAVALPVVGHLEAQTSLSQADLSDACFAGDGWLMA